MPKSRKMASFLLFSVTLNSIISRTKSLNKVILDDSYISNIILEINVLYDIYSVEFIEIFDVKIVYIHQGISVNKTKKLFAYIEIKKFLKLFYFLYL